VRSPTIGLEVHVQLNTASKMFCSCPVEFGAGPNSRVCPVCLALPGALPVLNRQAVESAFTVALALHCQIQSFSQFHRKNYFYPDLPKGYQISQYDVPFSRNGYLMVETEQSNRRIGIIRVHMEEDTAKMLHGRSITEHATTSLVDFNRSGVPLLEIVSAPDITSAEEASAYLTELRAILRTLGISSGNMEEGALRCDVNISLDAGTRAEVKNINSFRSVRKALEYEIERQNALLDQGEPVVQETRHFKESSGITVSGRTKEEAEDYRYFPEPDLVPLEITPQWIDAVHQRLPELPEERRRRLGEMGLFPAEAATIANAPELARFFDKCLLVVRTDNYVIVSRTGINPDSAITVSPFTANAKEIANWLLSDILKYLNESDLTIDQTKLTPIGLVAMIQQNKDGRISKTKAKELVTAALQGKVMQVGEKGILTNFPLDQDKFDEFLEHKTATVTATIAAIGSMGLTQISDPETIRGWVQEVLAQNPKEQDAYRLGKDTLFGFFVGQAMKRSGGKANPELLNRIVREELGK